MTTIVWLELGGSVVQGWGCFLVSLGAFLFSGCGNFFPDREAWTSSSSPSSPEIAFPKTASHSSSEKLCDIERTRGRIELLKRLDIEKFKKIAFKVSKEITPEEILNLDQLESFRKDSQHLSWEVSRRRGELVNEIYSGAIMRAGFKPGVQVEIQGTPFSYRVGVDPLSSGNDPYVSIVLANLSQESGQAGSISQISLGASPDQKRYFVWLHRFSRFETAPDGSQVPVYTPISLFDSVEETLPHSCKPAESALKQDDFNTVAGFKGAADLGEGPAAPPEALPLPSPSPVPSSLPSASPLPQFIPSPVPSPSHFL